MVKFTHLHHALEARWLGEGGAALVLVLGVHKLYHNSLVLARDGLDIGVQLKDDVVGVAREGTEPCIWIVHIALWGHSGSQQWVQLQ